MCNQEVTQSVGGGFQTRLLTTRAGRKFEVHKSIGFCQSETSERANGVAFGMGHGVSCPMRMNGYSIKNFRQFFFTNAFDLSQVLSRLECSGFFSVFYDPLGNGRPDSG